MGIKRWAIICTAVVALNSCAVVNTMGDYPVNRIQVGMSKDEARKVFKGFDVKVASASMDANGNNMEVWRYVHENFEYNIRFVNDILMDWSSWHVVDPNYYYWMENQKERQEKNNH